jgi:hypothetical protein
MIPLAGSSSASQALVASLGSRTVENDVAIPGNLAVTLFDLFHGYAKRAGII